MTGCENDTENDTEGCSEFIVLKEHVVMSLFLPTAHSKVYHSWLFAFGQVYFRNMTRCKCYTVSSMNLIGFDEYLADL